MTEWLDMQYHEKNTWLEKFVFIEHLRIIRHSHPHDARGMLSQHAARLL